MTPLLSVEEIHTQYGQNRVHNGVSIEVAAGEVVAILGPNGAGKTTLMSAVAGTLRVTKGRIRVDGRDVTKASANVVAASGIALAPEGRRVFASQTVRENLELGAYTRKDRSDIATDVEQMYDLFPVLREKERQRAGELSGGQQQMLAIARGLMARPKLLLLDEPSLGLSPKLVQDLQRIIERLRDDLHMSMLLVEQNAGLALGVANRAYLIKNGVIVDSGDIDELRDSDRLGELYLGVHGGAGPAADAIAEASNEHPTMKEPS